MNKISKLFLLLITGILFSCVHDEDNLLSGYEAIPSEIVSPENFPPLIFPEDNTYSPEKWKLGKMLFYDKRLSKDNQVSCGDCHKQEFAFGSNESTNFGSEKSPGIRNVPSLANVAFQPYFTREGAVPSLEMQILVPIQEHNEFNSNILHIIDELTSDTIYQRMSVKAYSRTLDAFVLVRAISTFERSLISHQSKYDDFLKNKVVLTSEEKKGLDLFFSQRLACNQCHSGVLFTNYGFENNGLYSEYKDVGRYRLTGIKSDIGKFKIPGLRNLRYTAPYMHDGSMYTLEEVLKHYNKGGSPHENKNVKIKPLALSKAEVQSILAFLNTLNDEEFIRNKIFR